jgi:hypothetical protein
MVANTFVQPVYTKHPALLTRWYLNLRYPKLDWLPRKDIFASLLLLLTGFSVPAGMCLGLLIASFPLVFLGMALMGVGGVLLLIRCGEI